MKRLLLVATVVAGVGGAGAAHAQEMMDGRRAGRFDVAVYAGGSLSSPWFESRTVTLNGTEEPTENDDAEDFSPGYAPFFGAHLTFWASPMFGVRLHGAYAPMRPPSRPQDGFFDGFENAGERAAYELNTYVYDAELVVRPFFNASRSRLLSSVYLWAGGGGLDRKSVV
jgi:opacity protein-like surface antigen